MNTVARALNGRSPLIFSGRHAFRSCFRAYLVCVENPSRVGGKNEEFKADFELVARRILADPVERKLFERHFVSGNPLNRGDFPVVSRVEEKLGRAFADLRPYPLFPVANYFSGGHR